jgi:UDP-glucose 4-epimerase
VADAATGILADGTDAVLHFAAKSLVGESVAKPGLYWSHNLGGALALLAAMRETGVGSIVFSSTAAVYGEPERVPIEETDPARPTSPYGASKLAIDVALTEYARLDGLGAVSLRYFNVAGAYAEPGNRWLRERHSPETHLIPNVLGVAEAIGEGEDGQEIKIFGDDYPTPDGTGVRDYIHVADLGRAHLLALGACSPGEHQVYNLGSGTGYSVHEVLGMCREVTGVDIPATVGPRRDGDPAVLVASSARIQRDLGWKVKEDLRSMVSDAWDGLRASS